MYHHLTLPGPLGAIQQISSTLRDGRNVLVVVPSYAHEGIIKEVYRIDEESSRWTFLNIPKESVVDPIYFIFQEIMPYISTNIPRNISTMIELPDFTGRVLAFDAKNISNWEEWLDFLNEYATASRSLSTYDRTVFCIKVPAHKLNSNHLNDVCLESIYWQNIVNSSDANVFARSSYGDLSSGILIRDLTIATAVNIGMWDLDLCEILVQEGWPNICHPEVMLHNYGINRGWDKIKKNPDADLNQYGAADVFDDRPVIHSALLELRGDVREIKQRLWRAELNILLPMIEVERNKLLDNLKDVLKVPYHAWNGAEIHDYYDLEIGHIKHQMDNIRGFRETEVYKLVCQLRDIRNRLAHFGCIGSELMAFDKVLNLWK